MGNSIDQGASIVINRWLKLKAEEKLLIVTTKKFKEEAEALRREALKITDSINIMEVEHAGIHIGAYFDKNEDIFDSYDSIIGATDYSLVTTKVTKRAIQQGKKYLSLPLSTCNGESMLAYDFLKMDTKESKLMAERVMDKMEKADCLYVTSENGTNLKFYKRNRKVGLFNGDIEDSKGYSSASLEIYIPVEETMTEGTMILDGSFGYIGKINSPIKVEIRNGKIVKIENCKDGNLLKKYIEDFDDDNMYYASEFGLGLNKSASCNGNCYIEDESAYGTFHVGFGRNIALGGVFEASGHYDLIALKPTIYADKDIIMKNGEII